MHFDYHPALFVLSLVAIALLWPAKWDPAILIKEWQIAKGAHPESPNGYVAWYRPPRGSQRHYIREYPAGNICQESYPAGRESVFDIRDATVYATEAEARAVLPVYDGSDGIEHRTGVVTV